MKMSKSKLLYVTLASSLAILSTACGAKKTDSSNQPIKFSQAVPHKTIKKGGTLTYALENESPFTGIFSAEIADTSPDSEAAAPGDEALFDINDHYQFTNKGAASLKLNHSNNTAEIKVKKKVRWSDGKPVTAKDLEYAYELILKFKLLNIPLRLKILKEWLNTIGEKLIIFLVLKCQMDQMERN